MGKCNPFAISLLRHTSQSLQKWNKKCKEEIEQHRQHIWNKKNGGKLPSNTQFAFQIPAICMF